MSQIYKNKYVRNMPLNVFVKITKQVLYQCFDLINRFKMLLRNYTNNVYFNDFLPFAPSA